MTTIPDGWLVEELYRDAGQGRYTMRFHRDGWVAVTWFPSFHLEIYCDNSLVGVYDTIAEAVAACAAHEHSLTVPAAYGPIGIDADGRPVADV